MRIRFALPLVLAIAAPAAADEPPFQSPPVLQGTPDVPTLVSRVKPGVVNITTTHAVKVPQMMAPFFGGQDGTMQQRALGSGFVFDAKGHVITNAHVVEGTDTVKVKLADDREVDAKVKGRDARLDIAVLEIEGAKDVPYVSLGSSDALKVGEYVVAIGNPFGLGNTVTMGIVSAKGRAIGAGPYDDFIQTDASINPGNSGGPLFNLYGQVVGINTAINPAGQGIGFAIPIDAVKAITTQLLEKGHVERGRLGVLVQPIDQDLGKALGVTKGALVAQVEKNGPAERAGIKEGDVIVGIDGQPITHERELPREIAKHAPGTNVKLQVFRNGKELTLDAKLAALEDENEKESPNAQAPAGGIGILARDAKGGGALVERVDPNAPAAALLKPGDVIVEVESKPVANARDLEQKWKNAPQDRPILLKIKREGQTRFVAIERK